KRRQCTRNTSRSPGSSPTSFLESLPVKTKSSYDLKRRCLQRGSPKSQIKGADCTVESVLKRDAFGSLESLFDLKKPLNLPDVYSLSVEYRQEGHVPPFESGKNTRNLLESIPLQQRSDLEPHILEQSYDDRKGKPEAIKEEPAVESTESEEIRSSKPVEEESSTMADNEADETATQEAEAEENEETTEDTPQDETDEKREKDKTVDDEIVSVELPDFPLPSGVGEGAQMKPGGRNESLLSSSPLTDAAVIEEMKKADERCAVIMKEIEELKLEIVVLTEKKELSEEDTQALRTKQEEVMTKLAEVEEITRQLQKTLGLSDFSSATFCKLIESQVEEEKPLKPEDLFDLPQIEYPEDKLPRVIVCGHTEDEVPKVVVADSKKRGKDRSLKNLTGKLTESLTMQEKLALENAQLEGGKYKLEEALLEKDSAVESLQRKVCGLQAEMRIVVKENTELTRQIASLNQRIISPCCYPCSGENHSPGSSPSPYRSFSYTTTARQDDDYCACKCCLQPQFAETLSPNGNSICVRRNSQTFLNSGDSPRLAGGASRTGALLSGASSQDEEMCCRTPAAAKQSCPPPPPRGTCPEELENQLASYGNNTKQLQQQLGSMEWEVRNMQIELANVQRERQQLEQQRKLLKCTGPCAPCGCCPPPPGNLQASGSPPYIPPTLPPQPPPPSSAPLPKMPPAPSSTCTGPCINAPMGASTCPQQQLRDLREQYARLQDDYKNKLCEVSCLRTDAEKLKQQTREAIEEREKLDIKLIDAQERLKAIEAEKDKYEGFKEQMVEHEQQLIVIKQRFRESQDEVEELRSLIQDQSAQLEDYRNKYLQAQQQVEEQRRQLDLMEMDNARMNENVTLEIGRVKNQFQEKLAELAPLPDLLKQTQVKLQEAQQMRLVAERNYEDLTRELIGCKDKVQTLQNQLDVLRNEYQALQEERGSGTGRFEELEKKNSELRHENERMKNTLARFEEHEAQLQKRIDEKMHEITQLTAMLDQVREDSARQVARTKERCETVRRSMQGQIAEMERQLAQCRATARAAQKDRDEIRQKMQGQINNLNEAFEQAQGRIRSLQGHVNYLKTSYSNIFKGQGEAPPGVLPGEPGAGFDSCDCNY
ncbi:Outer dense fiber protein 2, partial [Dufourea novaeangliae]